MNDYRFCRSCGTAQPPEKFSDYIEEDVNYHGLKCECGAVDDFDEMDAVWALEQIRDAYKYMRKETKPDVLARLADRLSAAEDELEAANAHPSIPSNRKKLIEIFYPADDDTGLYQVGEIDWSVGEELNKYIEHFGHDGIRDIAEGFAYLSWYIFDIQRSLPFPEQSANQAEDTE